MRLEDVMATDVRNRSDEFIPYPTNRVAGTITDSAEASKAVDALGASGFDRNDIDVLHGTKDLRRLDPDGAEHGLFAKLQRSLVKGAVGLEFKHLTHHVEDVQAGRFVVMVLAGPASTRHGRGHSPRTRRRVCRVLWSMGVRVAASQFPAIDRVGRQDLRHQRCPGHNPDSSCGGLATVLGTTSLPAVATSIGASLWLISWRRHDTAIVHALDVDRGVSYTSFMPSNEEPMHVRGTVRL